MWSKGSYIASILLGCIRNLPHLYLLSNSNRIRTTALTLRCANCFFPLLFIFQAALQNINHHADLLKINDISSIDLELLKQSLFFNNLSCWFFWQNDFQFLLFIFFLTSQYTIVFNTSILCWCLVQVLISSDHTYSNFYISQVQLGPAICCNYWLLQSSNFRL